MTRPAVPFALRLLSPAVALLFTAAGARTAAAQPRRPVPPPPPAPAPAPVDPTPAPLPEVPTDLVKAAPGGLTAQQVGARAGETSFSARASAAGLLAAAARVDAAWSSFLPRLTATARYTRLSSLTNPSATGGGAVVGTLQPAGTINPTPTVAIEFTFPILVDHYLLQAALAVPLSDYVFRLRQQYQSALASEEAARYDAAVVRARASLDGRVAFYTWLRARAAIVVAVQAVVDQRTHLNDSKNQFVVGNASRADVLRAETAVAAAELQVERAKNLASLTERQIRVAMHGKAAENLVPGEALDAAPPAVADNLPQLLSEAESARFELKTVQANVEALRKAAAVQRAGSYPVVSAFGVFDYANPNPRIFPQESKFTPTWAAGVQAVWSPNDHILANAATKDVEQRAAALDAQRQATRDAIELEVVQAFQDARLSDVAIESTKRELASAGEAYRVARELFVNGRGTSTTLTDAETELTRARLASLNAMADARIARVRLDHALGRDTTLAAK